MEMAYKRPMSKGSILVVDDEANARTALAELLRDEGYEVATAADGFKALGKFHHHGPDVVLTDLKMPGMNGVDLLARLVEAEHECEVILMTGFGAVETAVAAMRAGAFDYLTKPVNFDELVVQVERAIKSRRLASEVKQMRQRLTSRSELGNIIGASPAMAEVFEVIKQVGPSRASVLITGESGTGKELVAEALHQLSPRALGPFIKLHCAALAESLLESELFGHERGAFTGAVTRREGRFAAADRGTLFLDEIGEISPTIQVKLLRFLQVREFERVGGNETLKVDVRVVAATNRDLKTAVAEGRFREDLYYRLNVVNIETPPLRERGADVGLLSEHFLTKYAKENDKAIGGFTRAALDCLISYDWPGNVRELENVIERAVVMTRAGDVSPAELPASLASASGPAVRGDLPPIPGTTLAALEQFAIKKTLEAVSGSTSRAAEVLGISVRKIQYKLHAYSEAPKSDTHAVVSTSSSKADRADAKTEPVS